MNLTPSDSRLLQALDKITGSPLHEVLRVLDQLEEVLFWIKDKNGRFLWVNLCFLLNHGRANREEIVGRTDFDLSDAALANQFRLDDEKVLGGESIVSRIELVARFNHGTIWCTTTKLPLRDRKGRIVGTTGLTRPYRKGVAGAHTDAPLSGALELIGKSYTRRITNVELAKAAGLSLRVFHRKFQDLYHSSPHDYIRQLRVRTSCHALVYSTKSLAQIASEFGFSDQSHFTREFGRIMGETPRVFRARLQQ